MDTVSEFHAEAPQATLSEGLAQQCYFSSENHFYFSFYLVQYQLF